MTENSSCGGMASGVFFFNQIYNSTVLNESLSLMKRTVAAQSFLTSRLFSHSITPHLFIQCSSHSLLPTPLHHGSCPIVGPVVWVSESDTKHSSDIDTGDQSPVALLFMVT